MKPASFFLQSSPARTFFLGRVAKVQQPALGPTACRLTGRHGERLRLDWGL
jgi:hypothetical protein